MWGFVAVVGFVGYVLDRQFPESFGLVWGWYNIALICAVV